MNPLWTIIAIEIFVVVLILLAIVLTLGWRRKKRLTTEIERLLDEVDKTGTERKQGLIQFLTSKHHVAEAQASELSAHFIEAEKKFLHYLVKQQLEQSSLTGLYAQLLALLDQYLQLTPDAPQPIMQAPLKSEPVAAPLIVAPPQPVAEPKDETLDAEEDANATAETDEAVWNGTFAESNDLITDSAPLETVKAEVTHSIPESSAHATEEESDWNMAFEEADYNLND
jgi:hypothetical protein